MVCGWMWEGCENVCETFVLICCSYFYVGPSLPPASWMVYIRAAIDKEVHKFNACMHMPSWVLDACCLATADQWLSCKTVTDVTAFIIMHRAHSLVPYLMQHSHAHNSDAYAASVAVSHFLLKCCRLYPELLFVFGHGDRSQVHGIGDTEAMRSIQCSQLFLGLACWYETASASQPVFFCAYRTPPWLYSSCCSWRR